MASRISQLVIDTHELELLADCWRQVLGFRVLEDEDGYVEIGPDDAFGGRQPTLSSAQAPARDRQAAAAHRRQIDRRDREAELERLLALLARLADLGETGEESWCVLYPEGSEFYILRPWLS